MSIACPIRGGRRLTSGLHPKSETRNSGAIYIEWRRTMEMPRQQYSRELKIATMRELDAGKSMAHVAREYQLSPSRLDVWKAEGRAKGELAFPGQGGRPQAKSDAERMAQLERKIGQQTMEIDFLKKALRRFREHPLPVGGNGKAACLSKSSKPSKKRGKR